MKGQYSIAFAVIVFLIFSSLAFYKIGIENYFNYYKSEIAKKDSFILKLKASEIEKRTLFIIYFSCCSYKFSCSKDKDNFCKNETLKFLNKTFSINYNCTLYNLGNCNYVIEESHYNGKVNITFTAIPSKACS